MFVTPILEEECLPRVTNNCVLEDGGARIRAVRKKPKMDKESRFNEKKILVETKTQDKTEAVGLVYLIQVI